MSFTEMMQADWRDIIEWHELAVKVLVNAPCIQGLMGNLAWADPDGREKIMNEAMTRSVMIDNPNAEPRKDPNMQTKEEYLKRVKLLRCAPGTAGRIKFND